MLPYIKIHNYIVERAFKTTFKQNIDKHCHDSIGRALIYFKTTSLSPGYRHDYSHTNLWEVVCLTETLNQLGFVVDVVDRSCPASFLPENKYDLFIGIGTDDSGQHYLRFAKHLQKAVKILYATTSNPYHRNENIKQRFSNFEHRNNHKLPMSRLVERINFNDNMKFSDYVFCVGNDQTIATYSVFEKPTHKIWLPTAPHLTLTNASLHGKRQNNWLFFAGNGNILKGLDLVIESFARTPESSIFICTKLEDDFLKYYKPLIDRSKNIHIENFIRIKSKRFMELTRKCGFVILPSCTEGTATSVTTCMRRGLVPVVTAESGVDIQNFGYQIDDLSIDGLEHLINKLSQITNHELRKRVIGSYEASWQYTQQSYKQSISHALLQLLTHDHRLSKLTTKHSLDRS
jgi:glycosyltransferase involved in cell wall biosynthesis